MNETDEALYSRYLETDDDGDLEILLARHREGLLLFLLGFVRNPEDAEDLLMDTFARLAVDQPHFESLYPGSFRNWLYTIGRRNALMQLRKGKLQTEPLREDAQAETDLPEITLLKEERNRKLYQAITTLKPEYRQVLTLLYLEGLSHEEIAGIMGMNRMQVYNAVKRGKESLRKTLERMGITDAGD